MLVAEALQAQTEGLNFWKVLRPYSPELPGAKISIFEAASATVKRKGGDLAGAAGPDR